MLLDPSSLFGPTPDQGLLASLLILDLMLAVYHLWAVLDAYVLARKARPGWLQLDASPRKWATVLSVGVLVAGTLFSAKTLRIEPPLTITQKEMDLAVNTIEKVFKEVNAKHFEPRRPQSMRKP